MKKIFALVAVLMSIVTAPSSFAANTNTDDNFTPAQQEQIEQIIHNYLLNNPQILIEVSKKLQDQAQRQEAQVQSSAQQKIPSISQQLFTAPTSPVSGNLEGSVTLVEFFDYQCPHCKDMTLIVDKLRAKNPDLRVVYKEFPLFGGSSLYAARAALAAQNQGKYQEFHDALMAGDVPLSNAEIMDIARATGLDPQKLLTDMNSSTIDQELNNNRALAKRLELLGTPAFVIGRTNNATSQDSFLIPGQTTQDTLQNYINQVKNSVSQG